MRSPLTLLLLAACTLAPAAAAAQAGSDPASLIARAEDRYSEGDLEGALALYLQAAGGTGGERERARALVGAAWLQHRLERDAEAQANLTRALVLDAQLPFQPSYYDAPFVDLYRDAERDAIQERERLAAERNRGAIRALDAGDNATARRLLEAALDAKPNDPVLVGNLALLDLREGNRDAAIAGYQKVLALDRSGAGEPIDGELRIQALTVLGALFLGLEAYEDAVANLEEAVARAPDHRTAWHNLGAARRGLGDTAGAVEALERAHALGPAEVGVLRDLVGALADRRAWSRIEQLLTPATAGGEAAASPHLWLELGNARQRLGDRGGSIAAFEKVLALDPDRRLGLADQAASPLAYQLLAAGDNRRAEQVAARLAAWRPDYMEAWSYLGLARLRAGDAAGAAQAFTRARELAPRDGETVNNLGMALEAQGDIDGAEAAFRAALSLAPELAIARTNLDRIHVLRRAPTRALGLRLSDTGGSVRGARVAEVVPGSIADLAKLQVDDIIVTLGETPIASAEEFRRAAYDHPPKGLVMVEVIRGEKSKRLKLRVE